MLSGPAGMGALVDVGTGPFTVDVGTGIFVADVGAGVFLADIGTGVFDVGAGVFAGELGSGTPLVLERVMRVNPSADTFGRFGAMGDNTKVEIQVRRWDDYVN